MSSREIQRLRRKFIIVAMTTFFGVMLFICFAINLLSQAITDRSIYNALDAISSNASEGNYDYHDQSGFSPSIVDIFSSDHRLNLYYVLKYDENMNVTDYVSSFQDSSDLEYILENADEIFAKLSRFGRYGKFYYLIKNTDSGETYLTVRDCSSEISSHILLMTATGATFFVAFIISLVLVLIWSKRMIQPEIENSSRQKEFITNASHELKTPLAVIRANTECTELFSGETEWTRSTLTQVDHLNGLIQNLVMISRAQEKEDKAKMTSVDASKAVKESVAPYNAVALQSGKTLNTEIEEGLTLVADESKIRQLTALLIDNAVKYCDEGGTITVSLENAKKPRKGLALSVSNSYAEGANTDYNHFFDRFYREDKSHNIDKGGYGIGLSIAESICSQTGGSIKASWKDGVISFICNLM